MKYLLSLFLIAVVTVNSYGETIFVPMEKYLHNLQSLTSRIKSAEVINLKQNSDIRLLQEDIAVKDSIMQGPISAISKRTF